MNKHMERVCKSPGFLFGRFSCTGEMAENTLFLSFKQCEPGTFSQDGTAAEWYLSLRERCCLLVGSLQCKNAWQLRIEHSMKFQLKFLAQRSNMICDV